MVVRWFVIFYIDLIIFLLNFIKMFIELKYIVM